MKGVRSLLARRNRQMTAERCVREEEEEGLVAKVSRVTGGFLTPAPLSSGQRTSDS